MKRQRCLLLCDVSPYMSEGDKSELSDGFSQHQQKQKKLCTYFCSVFEACQKTQLHSLFYNFFFEFTSFCLSNILVLSKSVTDLK